MIRKKARGEGGGDGVLHRLVLTYDLLCERWAFGGRAMQQGFRAATVVVVVVVVIRTASPALLLPCRLAVAAAAFHVSVVAKPLHCRLRRGRLGCFLAGEGAVVGQVAKDEGGRRGQ